MSSLTKKALAGALKERLKKSPLENIRIKDITDDIGVNRQTFYYHFQDIYDLLEWMFEEEARKILTEEFAEEDLQDLVVRIVEQVREEEVILKNVYSSVNRKLLDKYLRKRMEPICAALIEKQSEGINISEENKEFIASFLITAALGLVFEWFESEIEYPVEEKMDKLVLLIGGDLKDIIRRFEEKAEGGVICENNTVTC